MGGRLLGDLLGPWPIPSPDYLFGWISDKHIFIKDDSDEPLCELFKNES